MTRKIFLQLNNGRYVEFEEAVEITWGFDAKLAERAHELHLGIKNESERTPQKWVEIAECLFAKKYSEIDNFFCYFCTTWESKEDVRFYCDREKIGAEIYYRDEEIEQGGRLYDIVRKWSCEKRRIKKLAERRVELLKLIL